MPEPLKTPLYDAHVSAGGRMVEFAGYLMPVQYQGVIAESKAVREGAGMFDVSHMARLHLKGAGVLEFLEHVTTNDVAKLTDGHGHYSLLPNAEGGLVDDIIVYRVGEHEYRMVVNASNHAKDVAHLHEQNTFGVEMEDETDATAMIAVQGPKAAEIIAGLSNQPDQVREVPFFSTLEITVAGVPCFAARSGYTGEDGYELVAKSDESVKLWDALVEAGVTPCGLGSRDTLRVEAGLPLYGHELADDISPIAAGLGWVISKTKAFLGSQAINQVRKQGSPVKLHGIQLQGKRLPQPGMTVHAGGQKIGTITSGVYSPLLERGIAFAYLDSAVQADSECTVDIRGKEEPAQVVNKRFFKRI